MPRRRENVDRQRLLTALLALSVCLCGTAGALAADSAEAARDPHDDRLVIHEDRTPRSLSRPSARLRARAGLALETVSALDRIQLQGGVPGEPNFSRRVNDQIESAAVRAGRDRLRDELLSLPSVAAAIERRIGRRDHGEASPRADDQAWRMRFGVRHAIPGAEIRRSLERGDLRIRVDLTGRVGLRFRRNGTARTQIGAGFDGDDTAHVSCVIDF